jgi:hypothetical protein
MEFEAGDRADISKWINPNHWGPHATIHSLCTEFGVKYYRIHFDGYDYLQGGRYTLNENYHTIDIAKARLLLTKISTNYSPDQNGDTEDDI